MIYKENKRFKMTEDKKPEKNIEKSISSLKTFIKRRFDELSMEINATSQIMGINESKLEQKFKEIIEVLEAVSTVDVGGTSSNSGYELDTVVNQTEKATNDIMDAAERIGCRIKEIAPCENLEKRNELIDNTKKDIQTIMLSCSFQDLTGQRIHNAVTNIKSSEKRLYKILEDLGIEVSNVENLSTDLRKTCITSQKDIDTIFDSMEEKKTN